MVAKAYDSDLEGLYEKHVLARPLFSTKQSSLTQQRPRVSYRVFTQLN
jgi:hypothetical protein